MDINGTLRNSARRLVGSDRRRLRALVRARHALRTVLAAWRRMAACAQALAAFGAAKAAACRPGESRALQPVDSSIGRIAAVLDRPRTSPAPAAWDLAGRALPPAPPIGRWIVVGAGIGLVAFGGFGGWAASAPLASASIARGAVKVESNRKTIQHYEGGIIREILVRDGDAVVAGQLLVRLDDVEARSDHQAKQGNLDSLNAREARLVAQRDGLEQIAFPDELRARKSDLETALVIEGQMRTFATHESALKTETAVLRTRVEQYRAQIKGIEAQNDMLAEQRALLTEELAVAQEMLERGLERRPRVLGLQRQVTSKQGDIAANLSRIAALNEQIAEAELQITALGDNRQRAIAEELREVQTARAELMQRLQKSGAQVGRRDIIAPQDGVVMGLRYVTPGGVIAAGAEILDLVPTEDRLIVEAQVNPMDINVVRPGLAANVRLVAFNQRSTPSLKGLVGHVSADAITHARSGETYFLARIEVPPEEMARAPHVELYPGMPVEVAIETGRRTLLAYLMQPLTDSVSRAFKEQ